ncbi:zinc finger lsd1 subclass family protein (macronuclear) [Tetrahymena thermophila SB210]|uniref:Zinc finger lsd1 subclass family protein n=1 Tax=Tetrahymena thermophila (strain SB210) TaxID=312017 RepID=W7XEA2_TETTS|nr:zinc finger lsd1 subclass family protein [Tetrahymena thermophila SB210]EWS76002.1 zinc finger lsd1 subclass family protein [Tetrahymena thermophila SB210]|eukprot:XP_012651520.1 zinc finger lsd1 subclass family protein [Tetrahymena thermophila SB210]
MKSNKYFLFFLTIIYSIIQRIFATYQVYYNFHDQGSNLKELNPLLISENISNYTYSIKVESKDLISYVGATYQAKFELNISSPSQSVYSFTIEQILDQPYLIYTIFSYTKEEIIWKQLKIKGLKLFINIKNYQIKQSISLQNINSSFLRLLSTCGEQQFFHPIYQSCENCHPRCKGCTEYKKCKDCQQQPGKNERYDQLADGFCDFCPSGQTWKPDNKCKGCSVTCNCDSSYKYCISCKDSINNQLNVERNTCEPCQLDQGYYIDGQFCKRCNLICKTCKGPSDSDCLQCIDGAKKYEDGSCKYNNQNPNDCVSPYKQDKSQNCVLCNQDGYYIKDKNCVECQADLKCQKCSPETQCTQCYANKPEKYLQDGKKCTDCKQNGYFINQSLNICDNCIQNCDICNNKSECQKCISGFYVLEDNKSCSQCKQDGYYIDKSIQFCNKCPQEKKCQKCNNDLKCTECQSGLYLFNQDNCISCGEGYFQNGKNCFKCTENCQICADQNKCKKCSQNFYLFNGGASCIPCNSQGQFQQSDTCQLCDVSCSKCQGMTQNDCLECKDSKQFSYKGKCEACSRDGVFQNGRQCFDCAQNCKSCTGVEIEKCTQCIDTFSFQQDKKCIICPTQDKYFIDGNNFCLKCHDTCQTCSDEKEISCKTCIDQLKIDKYDRKCKICNTNNGFFVNSQNECEKCHSTCKQCDGTSESNCKECTQGLSFLNGKCQKCNTENSYYIDKNNNCLECNKSCQTCSSKDVCIKCKAGLSFPSDQASKLCINCDLDSMYVKDPEGLNICQNCHMNCKGCKGPNIQDCIQCKDQFYFNPKDNSCETCNLEADKKYIDDNKYCQNCDVQCKTCTGPGNGKCKLCAEGLYFNDQMVCIKCPSEKFYITDYKYCKKCHDSCLTCNGSSDNNCLSCANDLALQENSTCKQCQIENGFFVANENGVKVCKQCDSSCKTCHGQNNTDCDSCLNLNFLIDSDTKICQACQTENKYFQDGVYCKKCDDSCKKCKNQDAKSCIECAEYPIKLYFRDGICQKCEESEGFYIKDDKISCEKCESSCKTCYGGQSNQCKTCQENKYLFQDYTCKECDIDNKFFKSEIYCLPCNQECQTCYGQGQDQCLSCPVNKFLLTENGKQTCIDCLSTQSYYQNGNNCIRCDSSCLECKDSNKTSCTKCRDTDYEFEDGTCQLECPQDGYFKEGKKCKKCHSSCKQCKGQGQNECLLCNGEQKIYPEGNCNECQINNKYFIQDKFCLPCHNSCKTCKDSSEIGCLDCNANLYKQVDQTCKKCDLNSGMFVDKADNICKKCDLTCQTCSTSSENDCLTCSGNRKFYHEKNSTQKKCILCQVNNKQFEKEDMCLDCDATCLTCSGASETECITCDGQYLMHQDKKCKICDTSNGFYIQDKNCIACSDGCQTCDKDGCKKCIGNFKLKEGVCTECKLSDGYFIQDSNCIKCHSSCKECSGPSQFDCTTCKDNQYLKKVDENDSNSQKQCQECPNEGYFVKDKECVKCHDTCLKCHSQDSTGCDVCKDNLKFRTDKTCQKCPSENFYVDKDRCLECFADCKTCSGPQSNQCLSCKEGLNIYYKDNICRDCNKDNFWISKEDNICYDCHYSCQTCNGNNKENCTKCQTPFMWLGNLCDSCPKSNYYADLTNNKCIACHQSCEFCSSDQETDCLKCKNDAKFHTEKINQGGIIQEVKYCKNCQINNGYFVKGDQCLKCHSSCLTCDDEQENKCKSCQDGLFLFEDGTCKKCPNEEYYSEKINQINMCKQCSPNCLTCSQFGDDKCLTCKKDLYKNDSDKCEKCETDKKVFIKGDRCLHCDSTCKTCKDESPKGCDKCEDNLSKLPDKTCQKCPQKGYFLEGEFCKFCHNTCEECEGENQKQCKICATGLKFWKDENGDQICVKCQEKIAHYVDGLYCKPCHSSCLECSGGDQSQCKKCVEGKYFKNKNNQGEGQCLECAGSYFVQGDLCLACHQNCQTCKGSQETDCIQCAGQLKFNKDKSKCINCRTDNGQFLNNDICYDCDKSCKICNGESNTNCLQCIDDLYFFQEDDNTKNKCKQCPSELYYIDLNKRDCLKCDDSCQTCKPGLPKQCLKCKQGGTFMDDGTCQICPEFGFFVNDGKCLKCDPSCKKCQGDSALNCTECHENNYFDLNDSNKCKECDTLKGHFIQNNKNCQKCNDSCQTCKDDTEFGCLTCKNTLYFKDFVDPSDTSKVKQKCETCDQNNGWVINGADVGKQKCQKCHESCKTCSGIDAKQCTECKNELYFRDEICQQCDVSDGFFIKDKFCLKCSENCKTCSGTEKNECLNCRTNKFFIENTQECQSCNQDQGFYLDTNSRCFKCHSSCKTCNGSEDKNCTKCADKLSFLDGLCKICDVQNKYYIEESTNKCLKCHDTCQTCKGSGVNQCLSCKDKLTFDEDNNCITCPSEGYYVDNHKCIKCHDSCKQCSSQLATGCTECQTYLFYYPTSKLCKSCDIQDGYFVKKEPTGNFSQLCLSCHQDCKTCIDEQQNNCLICREVYSFKNDKNICKNCHKDCQKCNGEQQTDCIECKQPGYHIRLDMTCGLCLSNQYLEDNHCKNCSDNCLKCGDIKTCQECGNNTHIKQNGKCGECEKNEYADKATNKCMPCHETCLSCKGSQNNECLQCQDGALRIRTDTKQCGKCDSNQYYDNIQCYDCHRDCKTCSGPGNDIDQCTSCVDVTKYECNQNDLNYFAQNYQQKKQCEKKCLKCHQNCNQCFGEQSNQCMKCDRMILQNDFSCQRKCPERMFFDESDPKEVKCTNCEKNCKVCENQNKCLACDEEYTLLEGQCYKCLSHQYLDQKLKKCIECDSDCKTCFNQGRQACIECSDPAKFFDQDNFCVSQCVYGYIKNDKTNRCQKCKYIIDQKTKSKTCVVDCNKNQFLDPQTQICNDCQNNCSECESLTKCTSCIQNYHFVSEKQEACRKCEQDEYISSKNVCKKCEFLNCLTCNENHCTKCSYKYLLNESNTCKYDDRYNYYECTDLNKLDDSCEKEMQLIDKIDFGMKQSIIATYSIQAISFFILRSTSVMSYSIQIQQQIGNSYLLKDSLKSLSLGPTFYQQNFQQNLINMIPNPFRYISAYDSYFYPKQSINSLQSFKLDQSLESKYLQNNTSLKEQAYQQANQGIYNSSQNITSNSVKHLKNEIQNQQINSNPLRNLLQEKRELEENSLIQNNLRDIRSQELSSIFVETIIMYSFIFLLIILFYVIVYFFRNKYELMSQIYSNRFKFIIQMQQIFSNFIFTSMLYSYSFMNFSSMSLINWLGIAFQVVYIIFYCTFGFILFRKVRNFSKKVYDEDQLKYQLFFIEGIATDLPFNKYFWFIFEFRKVIILLLQFCVPLTEISVLLILIINFSFLIFYWLTKPFEVKSQLWYYFILEILNFMNSLLLCSLFFSNSKIISWWILVNLMLINFIVLIYTIYSLCRGIYIKYFKVRFIVSKVQETEVSIKWKQIRNNFKLKRYIISKKNAPIPLSVNEILNQSADISQFSSYSSKNFEEKSDCINELSIKWQINPLKVREIALPKIQK